MSRCTAALAFVAACATSPPGATPVEPASVRAPVPEFGTDDATARIGTRIDAVMKPWANEGTPGCAVAVIRAGEIVHAKGYGMADLERGVPITPDSVFDIGSISKQFTAAAVLLAAAEGKLSLDDATKRSLSAYLDAKIFVPLGMTHTRIDDDPNEIIPGRAIGYSPREGGWKIDMWRWERTGPGAVMTTVLDLAKWDANFYDPKVGGQRFLDAMHTRGKLEDDTELDYAAGLFHGSYRGQPTVVHPGGGAGYVAQLERFTALETSIAVLCNAAGSRPDLLAHHIADVVLEQDLKGEPAADAVPPTIQLTTAQLDAWVATYRQAETRELVAIEREGDTLQLRVGGDSYVLDPTTDRTFLLRDQWFVAHLDGTATARTLTLRSPMGEEVFAEAELHRPTARELAGLAGRYRSEEIGTEWTLSIAGDQLVATGPAFDEAAVLLPAAKDEYSVMGLVLRFRRDRRGRVTGFALRIGSMQGIGFDRVR